MAEQSLTKNILKKGIFGVVLGIVLFLAAEYVPPMFGEHGFPFVFKVMFFMYAFKIQIKMLYAFSIVSVQSNTCFPQAILKLLCSSPVSTRDC